ncbi:MAG: AAA family ATPase [Acidobacteriota bacterium]
MPSLLDGLIEPGDEVIETHISWVVIRGDDVFKIKKPVSLGFLDFSTLELRRRACDAEKELNERLAPGVYHGRVPLTRDDKGQLQLGGDGEVVEWAVHMSRMPEADRADVRLADGRLDAAAIELVARRLATFHAAARCDEETAGYGTREVISGNVKENFDQTRERLHRYIDERQAAEVEAWQIGFLATQADHFDARRRSGYVRDGHGDLRLEHVYIDANGEVVVLDCIEFNPRFRFADVCADIAFLAMDLTWHDRSDLAETFLAAYARETQDYGLYRLVDFYESYRAFVRGKIASITAEDSSYPLTVRERATREARKYFLLAQASGRRSLVPPRVVAVGGLIATGKSTLARTLGSRLAAPVIEADRARKSLLGVEPTAPVHEPSWSGAYSEEQTDRTYDELLSRAETVLASGRTVILDASFRSRAARRAARELAEFHGVSFLFVECQASRELCMERLRERERWASTSDGRREIFDDFAAAWEPADELDPAHYLPLDTALPLESNLETLSERLGA